MWIKATLSKTHSAMPSTNSKTHMVKSAIKGLNMTKYETFILAQPDKFYDKTISQKQ